MFDIEHLVGMESFSDPTNRKVMDSKRMDVVRISMEIDDKDPSSKNYCPVYCQEFTDGHREYSAYLTGPVEDVNEYFDLIDILLASTENDIITIYIDSPGGMIASGGLIASAIDGSRATVKTVARGLCASAAALIHSAAKPGNATVEPFAMMLYHMSSHYDSGTSTAIRERAANQVNYVNETLLSKALADGHITQDEFDRIQTGVDIMIDGREWNRRVNKENE